MKDKMYWLKLYRDVTGLKLEDARNDIACAMFKGYHDGKVNIREVFCYAVKKHVRQRGIEEWNGGFDYCLNQKETE